MVEIGFSCYRLLLILLVSPGFGFNLDEEAPSVFSGPDGSFFGFSVDFFKSTGSLRWVFWVWATVKENQNDTGRYYLAGWNEHEVALAKTKMKPEDKPLILGTGD